MRNGISARIDEDLLLLLREFQKMRLKEKTDRYKRSIPELSYILYKLINQDKSFWDKMVYTKG